MRACVECLVERLLLNVLKVKEGHAFSEFRRIVIQDGSSFAVKNSLPTLFKTLALCEFQNGTDRPSYPSLFTNDRFLMKADN